MTYLQYVGDNTDHDVAIIDGKNTHHSLGNIAMTNRRFSNLNTRKTPLPEEKKQVLSDIESTQVIPTKITMHKASQLSTRLFYIQSFRCSLKNHLSIFFVLVMLPVKNLSVTNMTALHSLLCFVVEQSKNEKLPKPSITFDKPLYVKASEMAMLNMLVIFVRLSDFH